MIETAGLQLTIINYITMHSSSIKSPDYTITSTEMDNISNNTNSTPSQEHCPYDYCVEDTIYRKVVGTLIFLIVWPFIVQDVKYFPLGRPAAALLGATLMVVFTITPQEQTYRILGDQGNIQTICLLIGMMALSYYYDREGLLRIISLWIFGKGKPFRHVLWKVCILSAVLSALITNDATCVVITPLLLTEHKKQKRSEAEIAPLLLSIATSANIGSASTFFGNPQNAYIASNAGLSLLIFFITSLPAAIIGLSINIGMLYLIYYKIVFGRTKTIAVAEQAHATTSDNNVQPEPASVGSIAEERFEQSVQYDNSEDPFHSSDIAAERDRMRHSLPSHHTTKLSLNSARSSDLKKSAYGATGNGLTTSLPNISPSSLDRSRNRRDLAMSRGNSPTHEAAQNETSSTTVQTRSIMDRRWNAKIFLVWLAVITIIVIGLLAVPPLKSLTFNLGLVPFGAAVFTMVADTIFNCKYARDVMIQIDWPVILMFFGLFVWLAGFENTNLPNQAFNKISKYMDLSTIGGVLLFTVFVIVGSNIISNVPLVILLIKKIDTFECGLDDCSQLVGVLLAWISTVAGNFTLIGSIANLIVAEKARSCTGYNLTFFSYLKFGFISTFIVLFSGLPIVYFTGRHVNIDF